MPSWQELETRFSEVVPGMKGARVDGQWGSAGEYWRVAAYFDLNTKKLFETIARIAGKKLEEVLQSGRTPDDELLAEGDPAIRWYKAIWKISGAFQHMMPGQELDKDDNVVGVIYLGSIPDIAECSVTLCLEMQARHPEKQAVPVQQTPGDNLSSFQRFWDKYGVPIITAIIATIIGGLLLALILYKPV
jgi:hypothetical protein